MTRVRASTTPGCGIQRGEVAALEPDITAEEAREVVDVSGKLVVPGLVDVHGHYFRGIMPSGIDADRVCLPNGVTTSVDAGSSGWLHFDGFKDYVLSRQETRLYAFINLSAMGMYNLGGDFGPALGISGGPQSLFPRVISGSFKTSDTHRWTRPSGVSGKIPM